ncbi:MAG: DNA-protecting protein DprA [Deltaproteobacteria bacterium]|nr:DNA-protecting protein DprA [Deltaproteobacteria bacterium]
MNISTPTETPSYFEINQSPWLSEILSPVQKLNSYGFRKPFEKPCFAIVGTRKPSIYGIKAALGFSKQLASLGFTIVSGLARGIDSYAHWGALMADGTTVAVLGHGLGRIYPPENRILAEKIIEKGGALVSEYEKDEPPLKHHFPERNRIISGLSLGVLIIEAAEKSGSLITANFALDQNREVFVIGSRFDEPSFKGGNLLLQQGAKMVLTIDDVLEELPSQTFLHKVKKETPICDLELLKTLFRKNKGVTHLSDFYQVPFYRRGLLFHQLDQAIQQKFVFETPTRHFFWVE